MVGSLFAFNPDVGTLYLVPGQCVGLTTRSVLFSMIPGACFGAFFGLCCVLPRLTLLLVGCVLTAVAVLTLLLTDAPAALAILIIVTRLWRIGACPSRTCRP